MENNIIDITYDVRTDANGKDPDSASETLRYYHYMLWRKDIRGKQFHLDHKTKGAYLYHKSDLGEYYLSSDSIIHTYQNWKATQNVIKQIPKDEMEYFYCLSYTIGGFILFPGNKINGLNTMNQERGMNRYINDRMDLTLECIRRYYDNVNSPLFETIKRYSDFFNLFENFKGYCEYFLLQDLVTDDYSKIKFFLPFSEFIYNPLPNSVDEYNEYKKNNIVFLNNRNGRIKEYCTIFVTLDGENSVENIATKLANNFGKYKKGEISEDEHERIANKILEDSHNYSLKRLEEMKADAAKMEEKHTK